MPSAMSSAACAHVFATCCWLRPDWLCVQASPARAAHLFSHAAQSRGPVLMCTGSASQNTTANRVCYAALMVLPGVLAERGHPAALASSKARQARPAGTCIQQAPAVCKLSSHQDAVSSIHASQCLALPQGMRATVFTVATIFIEATMPRGICLGGVVLHSAFWAGAAAYMHSLCSWGVCQALAAALKTRLSM